MDRLLEPSTQYAAGGMVVALAIAFLLYQPTGLVKWLQKKNYQYEVTFSLYMLTPTEKFVFNSILFLAFSTFTVACILYLPDHLATISRRTYYYFAGEGNASDLAWQSAGSVSQTLAKASEAAIQGAASITSTAQEVIHTVAGEASEVA